MLELIVYIKFFTMAGNNSQFSSLVLDQRTRIGGFMSSESVKSFQTGFQYILGCFSIMYILYPCVQVW